MAAVVAAAVFDCAFVMLGHGRFALIDKEDVCRVSKHLWKSDGRYAKRGVGGRAGKALYLHRFILDVKDGMDTDHINHIKIDNRKCNLRSCTTNQNAYNSAGRKSKFSTSRFKGVSWSKDRKKFEVQTTFGGKNIHLGRFDSEVDAARVYNKWALEKHGEFAFINQL